MQSVTSILLELQPVAANDYLSFMLRALAMKYGEEHVEFVRDATSIDCNPVDLLSSSLWLPPMRARDMVDWDEKEIREWQNADYDRRYPKAANGRQERMPVKYVPHLFNLLMCHSTTTLSCLCTRRFVFDDDGEAEKDTLSAAITSPIATTTFLRRHDANSGDGMLTMHSAAAAQSNTATSLVRCELDIP